MDRLKDPYEKRRLIEGILHGPAVFADATGPERKRLEEEYRKTNPPINQEGIDKAKRYEDSLWKSGNALDAITQKNIGDLDTLSKRLDEFSSLTLKGADALDSFNKTMDAVRKNAEDTTGAWGKKIPKSPGRPLTIWEQLFGLKPENQSYNDPGGKTKDVIKGATSDGVVEGFLKFAMLMGHGSGDAGGARVIRASLGGSIPGGRTRSAIAPPPDAPPRGPSTASRPPPGDPGASSHPPASAPPMGDGADPNQGNRPYHIGGKVTMDGKTYTWGSGGSRRGSLPYGDFPINFGNGDIGSIGNASARSRPSAARGHDQRPEISRAPARRYPDSRRKRLDARPALLARMLCGVAQAMAGVQEGAARKGRRRPLDAAYRPRRHGRGHDAQDEASIASPTWRTRRKRPTRRVTVCATRKPGRAPSRATQPCASTSTACRAARAWRRRRAAFSQASSFIAGARCRSRAKAHNGNSPLAALLVPAFFRMAPFHVDANSRTSGRRIVLHEFPKRDTPYAEDMGRSARRFPVTGYVIGPDYQIWRELLVLALEAEGPGLLILPTLLQRDTILVQPREYTVRETRQAGGMAEFEMQFRRGRRLAVLEHH